MLDLQKETLFNILQACFPCEGVLDVFAGSGALGIEALSRGAASATFVERGRPAADAVRRNLEACGFAERARVLEIDAFRLDPARIGHGLGLVFLDPPFPLVRTRTAAILGLAARVLGEGPVAEGVRLMLRVPSGAEVSDFPAPLVLENRRPAGESVILLFGRGRRA